MFACLSNFSDARPITEVKLASHKNRSSLEQLFEQRQNARRMNSQLLLKHFDTQEAAQKIVPAGMCEVGEQAIDGPHEPWAGRRAGGHHGFIQAYVVFCFLG